MAYIQTGGGFVNEFPLSQPEEQVQLRINVEQVEGLRELTIYSTSVFTNTHGVVSARS